MGGNGEEAEPEAKPQAPARPPAKPRATAPRPHAQASQPAQTQQRPPTPPPADPQDQPTQPASRAADSVDVLIKVRKHLARRGNALRMAADEAVRVVEGFSICQGLPWDDNVKANVRQAVAEKLMESATATLFIDLVKFRRPGEADMVDGMPVGDLDKFIAAAKERVAK
jgi:hypothetical protein